MADEPLRIVVFGARGLQGGSVVRALLASAEDVKVVAVTREPEKLKAQHHASGQLEVAKADVKDESSVKQALKGAYAVFAVTNFWEDPDSEVEDGKRLAKLAKDAGVKHYIWSTLPNAEKISGGRYKVPHFTNKALVNEYVETLKFQYRTYIQPAFYYQNFKKFGFAKVADDGVVNFYLPLAPATILDSYDADYDTGRVVTMVTANPKELGQGQIINIAGERSPVKQYVDTFNRVTGKEAVFVRVPRKDYAKENPELAEMFAYIEEFSYFGKTGIVWGSELVPDLVTWDQFLQRSGYKG